MAAESEAHTPVAAAPVTTVTMTATPDKTAQSSTVTTAADDTKAADVQITRMPAMPAGPNATWPTAVATVWPGNLGVKVPDTFLATSHEWKRMGDYGGVNIAAWAEIFKLLGPSPVLRIGGASQDAMTEVPGEDTWAAMQKLQKTINCRWVVVLVAAALRSIGQVLCYAPSDLCYCCVTLRLRAVMYPALLASWQYRLCLPS